MGLTPMPSKNVAVAVVFDYGSYHLADIFR